MQKSTEMPKVDGDRSPPIVGLVIWSEDGEKIVKHATWVADERCLSFSRDEFIDQRLMPAARALEEATGKTLFPDMAKP